MKLLTKAIEAQLRKQAGKKADDAKPVFKLFNPTGAATWLFSELAEDGDTLFGLCDLGQGCPELGYASLKELSAIRVRFGLKLERDMYFTADKSLAAYAKEASNTGRIVA